MRMRILIGCQFAFSVMLTTVLCLGSVLSPSMATATVYYVATTGDNSRSCATAQTIGTPKQTIASGIACLSPGDTLYIRGGYYGEALNNTSFSYPVGSAWSSATTIAGYPGETPQLKSINVDQNPDGSVPAYLIFDNLLVDVEGSQSTPHIQTNEAFRVAGPVHHIRLSNSELRNANSNIIQGIYTTSFIEIKNNRIHNAFVYPHPDLGPNETWSGYGLYVNFSNSLIEGNIIYDNSGYGLNHYGSGYGGMVNNIIRNNIFYGNAYDDGTRGLTNGGMILASGNSNKVYNNVIYSNGGLGLLIAYNSGGNEVYNNTVYGNAQGGIVLFDSAPQTKVSNNIAYNNGSVYGAQISDLGNGTTGNVFSNNLTTNPQFVNTSADDFSLQAGSPAIDAGGVVSTVTTDIKGASRPQGATYDIGAYEYYTRSTLLSAPSNFRRVTVSR